MAQILVFGDSITYGAWDAEGGWVQRLRKFLDEKTQDDPSLYYLTYNLGVSGDTTEDLLERFEFETKMRLEEGGESIFVFAIGSNDSALVSPEKFQGNIKSLIKLTQKYSSKIIFVGLTPADESKTNPVSWNKEMFYTNGQIKKYNEIIKVICQENNLYFIEIFEKFIEINYKGLLEDGEHPNSKGHQKIFEIIKNFLLENRII